ncbi:unnamed protein product [Moneuplotes crassus]|uniref:C2H2-type domain-containing protein n=1 Tax=Euplotes crassus TaxID=5936 RepID=A0AAD1UHN1_EUPCR|nr:unnamed protein product [Moneuplotes crassus]
MNYNIENLHLFETHCSHSRTLPVSQEADTISLPVTFMKKGLQAIPMLSLPAQYTSAFMNSSWENKVYTHGENCKASSHYDSSACNTFSTSAAKPQFVPFQQDTGYILEKFSNLNENCKSLDQINLETESHDVMTKKAACSPSLTSRIVQLGGDVTCQAQLEEQKEFLVNEKIPILEGYQYALSYTESKGPRRRKRVIHCKYPGCEKHFIKAWNFLDHARMHLGEKPFCCEICESKFTQKGNLKKHMKKHQK